MPRKTSTIFYAAGLLVLLLSLTALAACTGASSQPERPEGFRTWLLVRAPDGPLPAGRPVTVRSRSEDARNNISHVELYAVELPGEQQNLLLRSDAAPFKQTSFTAAQAFTPVQPGHYVIKVVGYNGIGVKTESEYISFDVQ